MNKDKQKPQKMKANCDYCQYYDYDEDMEAYICMLDLDEDEMEQFVNYSNRDCPYFKFYDEYKFVQKQN